MVRKPCFSARGPHKICGYGIGIGSSGLPGLTDEQLSGAGRSAKRFLIQAIEFGSQIATRVMWLSALYYS
jgi:hypothetical protein